MRLIQSSGPSLGECRTPLESALCFYKAGFPVIPIVPGEKRTAVRWDAWLKSLSIRSINAYWTKHPDHGVGFIVPNNIVVFDADSPSAVAALYQIEKSFDITSRFIVKTKRGEHQYFRLALGVKIKTCSMDTAKFPHGIDVKAKRSMVLLPAENSGKSIEVCEIGHSEELSEIGQAVVDAVFRHNGLTPPSSPALLRLPNKESAPSTTTGKQLTELVKVLDPDMGYDSWIRVAMAISHETSNSDEGYEIFDAWSSNGSKYKGPGETLKSWRALASEPGHPVTVATVIKMVNDAGRNAQDILMEHRDRFTVLSGEMEAPTGSADTPRPEPRQANPLDRYSLSGFSGELEKNRQNEVYVLADIALLGQATAIYAAPNCGKTLAVMSLLSDAIGDKRINAGRVYYINADDNLTGLIGKVKIAEEFGFKMIGDGYRDFRAEMLLDLLEKMIIGGTAAGSIVIIDTAKRFTDLMSKRATSEFTALNRRFVSQGGTVIALAHVNKKKTDAGKSVYAGTSDIIDDFDCAFVVELLDDGISSGKRVIAFENKKSRGSVASVVHFSYLSPECVVNYRELLDSFSRIESEDAQQAVSAARIDADGPMIAIVKSTIQAGAAAKKDLLAALQEQAQVSRSAAATLIERYCGDDPTVHLWNFQRGERGVHRYQLHELKTPGEIS